MANLFPSADPANDKKGNERKYKPFLFIREIGMKNKEDDGWKKKYQVFFPVFEISVKQVGTYRRQHQSAYCEEILVPGSVEIICTMDQVIIYVRHNLSKGTFP